LNVVQMAGALRGKDIKDTLKDRANAIALDPADVALLPTLPTSIPSRARCAGRRTWRTNCSRASRTV